MHDSMCIRIHVLLVTVKKLLQNHVTFTVNKTVHMKKHYTVLPGPLEACTGLKE